MSEYHCNLPPTPRWKLRAIGVAMFAMVLMLGSTAYIVVAMQYKPFFFEEGNWRCTQRLAAPTEPDGTVSLVKARCTRYELKQ